MVYAVMLMRFLDGNHVLDIFHHTDHRAVTARVGANGTGVRVAYVMAVAAIAHAFAHIYYRVAEGKRCLLALAQQVQGEPQGCTRPHARQPRQLSDCLVKEF